MNLFLSLTTGPIRRSVLLMLTSMRNMVTSRAMRPGTRSIGIRKLMKEAIVSKTVGRYVFIMKGYDTLFMSSKNPVRENVSLVA